jgi:UDP-2,3-diacylglucosamine hydrolase
MIEAVFISDLHLNPNDSSISTRFKNFISWAASNTKSLYILGDFFHVWPGDDFIDPWSYDIAMQLSSLSNKGIKVYYMHGNRDFLLNGKFASLAGFKILPEPSLINLGNKKILLVHGDRYCTNDKGHVLLRRITRNKIFPVLFLKIPLKIRNFFVNVIRQKSSKNKTKTTSYMDIVLQDMLSHMDKLNSKILIHGHIHKPGLNIHKKKSKTYYQYVLSDWDDKPHILCYDNTKGFYFVREF